MRSARERLIVVAVLAGCGGAERVPSGGGGGVSAIRRGGETAITVDAGVAETAPALPVVPAAPSRVEVYYWPDDDQWEVTWRFPEPSDAMLFQRKAARSESWLEGDGLTWTVLDDGVEVLRTVDESERAEFSATFHSDYDRVGADQNTRFGDGSVLLYTGQLHAWAFGCDDRGCGVRDPLGVQVWQVTSDESYDRVRVGQAVAAGTLEWTAPSGPRYGNYIYIGRGVPVEVGGAGLLFDQTLPAWFTREAVARLPGLFAFYAERTGIALDRKPMVYAAFDRRRSGSWRRGRTVPGSISLEVGGRAWKPDNAVNHARWFDLLAHEVFHTWSGELTGRDPFDESWYIEGSATYVSALALEHEGILGKPAFDRRLLDDANQCLADLQVGLIEAGTADVRYTCGELVFFLIDRRLAADGGLFALLAETFAQARRRGGYSSADFLALLAARIGAGDPLLADLHQLLDHGLGDDPAAFMVRVLERAGLATAKVRGRAGAAPRLRLRTARLLGRPAGGARR